jgi:hypothetical protein
VPVVTSTCEGKCIQAWVNPWNSLILLNSGRFMMSDNSMLPGKRSAFLARHDPDVVAIRETKTNASNLQSFKKGYQAPCRFMAIEQGILIS